MTDLGDEYQDRAPAGYGSNEDAGGVDETRVMRHHAKPARKKRSRLSAGLELVAIVLGAVLIALLVQRFLVKPFEIPTESMVPTIEIGDRILVNRLAYKYGEVERGDIVVFKSPVAPDTDWVKRVIAVSGDTVEIDQKMVLVNGEPIVEDYVRTWNIPTVFPEQVVPEGMVFVLGDNRDNSQDARFWPQMGKSPWLDEGDIIGKAFVTYWPPSRIGRLH